MSYILWFWFISKIYLVQLLLFIICPDLREIIHVLKVKPLPLRDSKILFTGWLSWRRKLNRYTRDWNSLPHASLATVTIDYALRALQWRSRERRENSNGTHGEIRVYRLTTEIQFRIFFQVDCIDLRTCNSPQTVWDRDGRWPGTGRTGMLRTVTQIVETSRAGTETPWNSCPWETNSMGLLRLLMPISGLGGTLMVRLVLKPCFSCIKHRMKFNIDQAIFSLTSKHQYTPLVKVDSTSGDPENIFRNHCTESFNLIYKLYNIYMI